jgi:hypothetical protein
MCASSMTIYLDLSHLTISIGEYSHREQQSSLSSFDVDETTTRKDVMEQWTRAKLGVSDL